MEHIEKLKLWELVRLTKNCNRRDWTNRARRTTETNRTSRTNRTFITVKTNYTHEQVQLT